MELVIILILIVYATVKDYLFYKEREKLQMKLMSKDLNDYVSSTNPDAADGESMEDPYLPIEEVSLEKILKAKDVV